MSEVEQKTEKKTFRKKVVLPSDKDETQVKIKPKPLPKFGEKQASVRLNAAAILREEARLKKLEMEEKAKFEAAMIGLRDASDFERWQSEMKQKDEIQRLEQIQTRKIEMELAREEAVEALQQKVKENQLVAAKLKEESQLKSLQKIEDQKKELEEKKQLVNEVYESRANIVAEKEKVKSKNKQIKEELQKEIQEAIQRRREEEAIEQAKRDELIQQIRELEKQPINRNKNFDPNTIMGYGLLEEMSLAQLKERLELRKKEAEEEMQKKREENIKRKEDKNKELMDKVNKITENRNKQAKIQEDKRKRKQEEMEKKRMLEQNLREKGLVNVYEKIKSKKEAKKKEQEKLEKELKEIKLKRQYMNASKAILEEKVWKDQEAGAEREAKERQVKNLVEQERLERIKLAETNIRIKAAQDTMKAQDQGRKEFEIRLEEAQINNELLAREDRREKTMKHTRQKDFETMQRTNKNS